MDDDNLRLLIDVVAGVCPDCALSLCRETSFRSVTSGLIRLVVDDLLWMNMKSINRTAAASSALRKGSIVMRRLSV